MFTEYRQSLNEQIFSMPILLASLLSAKNRPGSGTVGIVAHLIIETQGHILSWSVVTRVTMGDGDMRRADTSDI